MRLRLPLVSILITILFVPALGAQTPPRGSGAPPEMQPISKITSIDERVKGMQKIDGFVPLYWDEKTGSLLMELGRFDTEILYSTGLSAGLGSNDIGLD